MTQQAERDDTPSVWTFANDSLVSLSQRYDVTSSRISTLYEQGKRSQWNAVTDIDWDLPVDFGSALPDDSAFAFRAFEQSPLSDRGRAGWDRFRWEFQMWLVGQFLHGEQGALVAAAKLAQCLPTVEAKCYAASQAGDEARHLEVFARYLAEHSPAIYPVSRPLATLLEDSIASRYWDFTALGVQVMLEPVALAGFRLANSTLNDPLIKQITSRVARDEGRHVSFGILLLPEVVQELTDTELRDRETFILEAAALIRRRFLLDDVWERLGVDVERGREFAARDPMFIAYRRAIFGKAVSALKKIGLLTPRVLEGLSSLDILGSSEALLNGTHIRP
jgi:hypothetical protein